MSIYPPVRRTMVGLLSQPRMSTYLGACAGDVSAAVDLYRWNMDVSMALFEAIHYLEVGVRNRADDALTALGRVSYTRDQVMQAARMTAAR